METNEPIEFPQNFKKTSLAQKHGRNSLSRVLQNEKYFPYEVRLLQESSEYDCNHRILHITDGDLEWRFVLGIITVNETTQ